jgi:hypothetical protein
VLEYFVYYTVYRYLGRGLLDLGAWDGRPSRPPPGPALEIRPHLLAWHCNSLSPTSTASYSHQPIGVINWARHVVEEHKWLEASSGALHKLVFRERERERELSVGVEARVGLLLVPQRVRYTFGRPHPGYFVSLDSWVTKSQVISLFALRFLDCGLSSFYLSWLLCFEFE